MATRRIKVADFRGEDVELEFPDGKVYPIRGDLPMPIIAFLDEIEEEADEETGTEWFDRGHALLTELVREKTPDAKLPMMSPQELLGLMGAIVGGESVGRSLVAAMQDGIDRMDPPKMPQPATVKRQTTSVKKAPTRKRKSRSAPARRSSGRSGS